MGPYRKLTIAGILIFCLVEGIYVSIPDFCYSAPAWEIMLWGESTQWWSEMTWILAFGLFSVSLCFVSDWNRQLGGNPWVLRAVMVCVLILASLDFAILYFDWAGFTETVILDRGGFLHGLFYLDTAILGLWLFAEGLVLGCRIMPRLRASLS